MDLTPPEQGNNMVSFSFDLLAALKQFTETEPRHRTQVLENILNKEETVGKE